MLSNALYFNRELAIDILGSLKLTERDLELIESLLCGPLRKTQVLNQLSLCPSLQKVNWAQRNLPQQPPSRKRKRTDSV